ncbi:MAG: exopolyphosphatase / guanosine-5'-triphosphate,3'-diphosphate pyrophosphatase [Gallionellaceae bacterium]|nr:MAG: exopolyphosphatase / guanosine-5'-triphosphate,3'-diphosphate pyrophosphatase [Gallionellaceae bacterium]
MVDDQLYMLDGLREAVRLAAGLDEDKLLDQAAQQRGLSCLQKFGERLRGLPPEAVRAVGTNSLRVAKNAPEFLKKAEAALGFPIEVIAGREEARLIYLGVAQGLPRTDERRMVMDIGGGSTEFIIGQGLQPAHLESLYMGCVSFSARYFADGKITKSNLKQAEFAARIELQTIVADYTRGHWDVAMGSSGSARVICDILEQNGYSEGGITLDGLEKLRELGIERMQPALGALREGVLYDLHGRFTHNDMREATVQQFMRRYHVAPKQAKRVAELSSMLAQHFLGEQFDEPTMRYLQWAANLHEIGISVAHSGYHKHSAYILANADMPGFSKKEQTLLSMLTLAHRGRLEKLRAQLREPKEQALVMSLRLATLFCRNRSGVQLPKMQGRFSGTKFHLSLESGWLTQNPLSETALQEEAAQWKELGISVQVGEA